MISHTTAGLAECLRGWSGSVTVDVGGTVVTVGGRDMDSVATLLARLAEACHLTHGGTWRVGVSTDAKVAVDGPVSHTLDASGTVETRLGITGPIGPALSTVAQTAHPGGYYAAQGLQWSGVGGYQARGRVTGDGSQVVPARPTTGMWSVDLRVAQSDAWSVEQIDGTYDLWRAGRVFGRMTVGGVRRVPAGESAQGPQVVRVVGQGGVAIGERGRRVCEATESIAGRLTAWVDRTVPGYRSIEIATAAATTPETYERVASGIDLGDGHTIVGEGHTLTLQDDGSVEYVDWCGWLLGMGEPGVTISGETVAPFVSPASIPLAEVTWTSVNYDRERGEQHDRWATSARASWGEARIWSVDVRLHEWALDALLEGWALRGKVRVDADVDSAIASGAPGGYIEGHVVELAGLRWLDSSMIHAVATLTIAQEVS